MVFPPVSGQAIAFRKRYGFRKVIGPSGETDKRAPVPDKFGPDRPDGNGWPYGGSGFSIPTERDGSSAATFGFDDIKRKRVVK